MAKENPSITRETIVYKGIRFRRYPDAANWAERSYYRPSGQYAKSGVEALHRELWKDAYGEIPDGCDIHHADLNPFNNDLSNLECLSTSEHHKYHASLISDEHLAELRARIDQIRPLAAIWHGSEAGIEWHRKHGREAFAQRELVDYVCEQCGKSYQTKHLGSTRFCSNACKSKWRRAAGLDNVLRNCEECGGSFTCNRYDKTRFCGNICSARNRERRK